MSSLNVLTLSSTLAQLLRTRVITQDTPPHQWPVDPIAPPDRELSDAARSITAAIVDDPGYIVVDVASTALTDESLVSDAWNLFTVPCAPVPQYSGGELISSVRVATAPRPGVSHYATSHATGGYHTDGAEFDEPPQVTGLLCMSSADSGGETLLMDGRNIVVELSPEERGALSRPIWFHSGIDGSAEHYAPVLNGTELRYLRRYIEEGHRRRGLQAPTTALDALDRLTDRADLQLPVLLRRGQMLVWNNQRFVHGRRPFTEKKSHRWLVRFYGMLR